MPEADRTCAKCGGDLAGTQEWVRHCPKCAGAPDDPQATYFSGRGYYLEMGKRASSRKTSHFIGGTNRVPGAVCNGHGCNRPFVRLITLDLRDPKLSFIPPLKRAAAGGLEAHHLPLFYCWPCGGTPTYRLEESGRASVLGRSSTGPEKDFPYPDYPGSFVERHAALALIPAAVQRRIREANAGTLDSDVKFSRAMARHMRPNHQVGGIPYLVQGDPEAGSCPGCSAVMPILAAASPESGGKKPFAGNPFMQVVFEYCGSCQIVSAWHQSD